MLGIPSGLNAGEDMLEDFRTRRAARAYESALEQWQKERDGQHERLKLVLGFRGAAAPDIVLAKGESLFFRVTHAGLVEERRSPGRYRGGSSGISVGFGPVRTRVGSSRGHYMQGALRPTVIDTGTLYVTNRRVIFRGVRQTRECAFGKLIGISHTAESMTFSLSNRHTPVVIRTGQAADGFRFRLELALAHYQGTVAQLASNHRANLAQIEARAPVAHPSAREFEDQREQQNVLPAGEPDPKEARRLMFAYEDYCVAQVAWENAGPAVRGPEPQWADYQAAAQDES